ncbi:hypothetical protein HanRHA438_Chr08g0363891 [Helianthus annuus]|uniref:Uncharacterized protein n=1 Tax=Helianthus annuus TaxID=4232 RepID=A0A9K3NEH3_HELAN|nr:hypothetical protein HanXRQr2_Chr08g0351591 [Helianthus annuus]KAJ0899053.1 hypothetical protein HanRHA438_Chr08g0363891 [Helianthus annuus]KAJ0902654.1 hypothetical protein HanPSC8_Chr08g0339581 [Helianthus annuus]
MSNSPTNSQSSSFISKKTTAEPPVDIGTKGTVGSLIQQEIKYFNKHEVHGLEANQTRTSSARKNKFIPSICSAIDVDNTHGPKLVSGSSYKKSKRFLI